MLSHLLGSCAGTAHQTDLKGTLFAFISEAAAANIVSGVQVSLLNELAVQFAGVADDSDEAGLAQQTHACQQVQTAAALGSTLQRDPSSPTVPQSLEHSDGLPKAPQLHIQPLNLSAGLQQPVQAPAGQQVASGFTSTVAAATNTSEAAAEDLSNQAAALMALTSSMAGSYDAAAAAAATALFQQQQGPYPASAVGQKLPDTVMSSLLGPSHELLQALAYAGDSAAAAAAPFAAAADPCSSKASSTRKQRFSRKQHAAILESVERNYAQYPSRYTELVIKEMQARFPGIELNNACVRKIKFRANEASKQQQPGQQQQDYLGMWPDQQAAADAAAGLVDLASAAAAAVAATCSDAGMEAAAAVSYASAPDQQPEGGDFAATVNTEAGPEDGCQQQDSAAAATAGCADGTAASSAQYALAAHTSNSPETRCINAEPVAAVLLAGTTAADDKQQQQQHTSAVAEPEPGCTEAAAVEPASRQQSSSSSALLLKVTQASQAEIVNQGRAVAAAGAEECVDSATAAAAEAMHLLAGISRGVKQQAGNTVAQGSPAAAAADCGDQDFGAAAAGSKRKRESPPACEGAASGVAASSPLPGPVAEALSAAADLTDISMEAAAQDQLAMQQAGLDPSYMPAACNQQQQQFMQQLLQLQQQQPWDLSYSSHMGVLQGQGVGTFGAALAGGSSSAQAAAAAAVSGGQQPNAKRQRLSGAQMAELVASVKHHVQANPERYTHCVIKDMKEKYPDLELNMGQIRKIKFRTLGNASTTKQAGKGPDSAAANSDPAGAAAAAAAACGGAPWM